MAKNQELLERGLDKLAEASELFKQAQKKGGHWDPITMLAEVARIKTEDLKNRTQQNALTYNIRLNPKGPKR